MFVLVEGKFCTLTSMTLKKYNLNKKPQLQGHNKGVLAKPDARVWPFVWQRKWKSESDVTGDMSHPLPVRYASVTQEPYEQNKTIFETSSYYREFIDVFKCKLFIFKYRSVIGFSFYSL